MTMDFTPGSAFRGGPDDPYMDASIPLAADFYHPSYFAFQQSIDIPWMLHRKYWEFAYIGEMLRRTGVLRPGARGLGFGCGTEPLPALFAGMGCTIVATDAPAGVNPLDWSSGNQWSSQVQDLYKPAIIDEATFRARVTFEPCDMNAIPAHLTDFDFNWSACCFEHLGGIRAGLDFIIANVESTLKIGGYACHTTEYNLSSNDATMEQPGLSIFRRRDIEQLIDELRARGHAIAPIRVPIGATPIDYHVDLPPFAHGATHIKLMLEDYVCTSIGLIVQRGR